MSTLSWMPWKNNKWRNSPRVQAMSLAAQGAYFNLLGAAWENEGKLPNHPAVFWKYALAQSREEWDTVAAEVLAMFTPTEDGKHLLNDTLSDEWNAAAEKYQDISRKRSAAGKKGNQVKWGKRKTRTNTGDSSQNRKPIANGSQNIATLHNNTIEESKNLAADAANDSSPKDERRQKFIDLIDQHIKGTIPNESARPAVPTYIRTVDTFLADHPKLAAPELTGWLKNRAHSDKVNFCENPRSWLPKLNRYALSPLDEYGKPKRKQSVPPPTSGRSLIERVQDDRRQAGIA